MAKNMKYWAWAKTTLESSLPSSHFLIFCQYSISASLTSDGSRVHHVQVLNACIQNTTLKMCFFLPDDCVGGCDAHLRHKNTSSDVTLVSWTRKRDNCCSNLADCRCEQHENHYWFPSKYIHRQSTKEESRYLNQWHYQYNLEFWDKENATNFSFFSG